MLDAEAREFVDLIAAAGAPSLADGTVEMARKGFAGLVNLLGPGPEVGAVADVVVPGPAGQINARAYEPLEEPVATVVYFGGGGWVLGDLAGTDAFARCLALASQAAVLTVDYRKAPEHVFPAAVEDAMAALQWAARTFERPLVVCGESAGGNLAGVCALRAVSAGWPHLDMQVLSCPVTDHVFNRPSYVEHGQSGLPVGTAEMRWFWEQYVPDARQRAQVDASPLRAESFAGLPPTYLIVAEYDPLRDEGLELADRMSRDGVDVTVRYYEDQFHGFATMVNYLRAADEAVAQIGAAIQQTCRKRAGRSPAARSPQNTR